MDAAAAEKKKESSRFVFPEKRQQAAAVPILPFPFFYAFSMKGAANFAAVLPVIANTIKIMVNWVLEVMFQRCFNFFT